jgi:hypothetical protein
MSTRESATATAALASSTLAAKLRGSLPRQLRADLDRLDGLQGACDGDGLLDAAALDGGVAEHRRIRPEGRGFAAPWLEELLRRFVGTAGAVRGAPGCARDDLRCRAVNCGEAGYSSEQDNDWHKSHIKTRLFEMTKLAEMPNNTL